MRNTWTGLLLAGWVGLAAGCATRPDVVAPTDSQMRQFASAGATAYRRGAVEEAAAMYQKALDRAVLMDDSSAVARNGYHLALCLVALGRPEAAHKLLEDVRAEAGYAGTVAGCADLVEARVVRQAGDRETAISLAQRALEEMNRSGDRLYRVDAYLMLADLACDGGDEARARAELSRAATEVGGDSSVWALAECERVGGRIEMLAGRALRAGAHFDKEADLRRRAGRAKEMVTALLAAGAAYEKAPDLARVADRYYRAARSLLAGGEIDKAHSIALRAQEAARASGDERLAQRIEDLLRPAEPVAAPKSD